MGGYQIHVEKTPELKIDVFGLSSDFKAIDSLDESTNPLIKLSSFAIKDPNPRFLKVEKRKIPKISTTQLEPELFEEGSEANGQKVEILHHFKTANIKCKDSNANVGDQRSTESQSLFENFAIFDLRDMKEAEPFIFQTFDNDSDTSKPECTDTNGNTSTTKLIEDTSANSQPTTGSGEVIIEDVNFIEQPDDAMSPGAIVTEPEGEDISSKQQEVPMALCFSIGSDLLITVTFQTNIESIVEIPKISRRELFDSIGQLEPREKSLESVAVSELLFNVPYREMFEDEIDRAQMELNTNTTTHQRDERKHLLRRLILQRLIALGVPQMEAHNITDTWNSSYIQHRALSYRIPSIRCKSTQKKAHPVVGPQPRQKPFEVQHKSEPGPGFVDNFVYHTTSCKGIVNSACCSLLESTFFVMIPHFKTKADGKGPFFPGTGINPAFIQNWIKLIKIAAFQLKPDDPTSVQPLVKKELKVMKNHLDSLVKLTKKMKEKLKYLNDKVDILGEKVYKKVKMDTMPLDIRQEIEKSEEPKNYAGFAHLQMVGFSAPDLYQNFLYLQTGKYGLFIKKTAEDPWFPYSDLNFLERRIVFLGIMDHMHSTFQAVESSLRHLEELYTPGYPMSLLQKIRPLLDLLNVEHPYQLLAEDSKVQIYGLTLGLKGAVSRFKFVFQELKKMIRDAHDGINKFNFTEDGSVNYNKNLGKDKDVSKINLAVPFSTYPLERFDHLKERGIEIKLSPDDVRVPGKVKAADSMTQTKGKNKA